MLFAPFALMQRDVWVGYKLIKRNGVQSGSVSITISHPVIKSS